MKTNRFSTINDTAITGWTNILSRSASNATPEKKYKSFKKNRVCLFADTGESADDIVSESSPEPLNIRDIWGEGKYIPFGSQKRQTQKNTQTANNKSINETETIGRKASCSQTIEITLY